MRFKSRALLLAVALSSTSCGQGKPTAAEVERIITQRYKDAKVIRIGDAGKGDFAAPGSGDTYWPVEFTARASVIDAGPLQVSADQKHQAMIWKDKLGQWQLEQRP